MSLPSKQDVLLTRPVQYILPSDLMFEGLALPQGKETARIRFSRGPGTTLFGVLCLSYRWPCQNFGFGRLSGIMSLLL
jgi:hypothetical protein